MFIEKEAIDYRKKRKAEFFVVQGRPIQNNRGCLCAAGVNIVNPVPTLGSGNTPERARLIEVEGEKVYVLPEAEACLTEHSTIKLNNLLMFKNLALENYKPAFHEVGSCSCRR